MSWKPAVPFMADSFGRESHSTAHWQRRNTELHPDKPYRIRIAISFLRGGRVKG